jgi:hypothetical protein
LHPYEVYNKVFQLGEYPILPPPNLLELERGVSFGSEEAIYQLLPINHNYKRGLAASFLRDDE